MQVTGCGPRLRDERSGRFAPYVLKHDAELAGQFRGMRSRIRPVEIMDMSRHVGHEFGRYDSQRAFLEEVGNTSKPHPFDQEVLTVILGWLKQYLPS